MHVTEARLNDYADGTLPPPEAAEVAAHLEVCPACRAEVEGTRALLAEAAALPRSLPPPPEVWAALRGETLDAPARGWALPRAARWAAAAAVVGAALSSALTAALLRPTPSEPTLPAVTVRPSGPEATAALVELRRAEAGYARTAADLEAALDAGRGRLAPETVRAVEESLRTIDEAIRAARAALARDPANPEIPHVLDATYRDKIDVLERAVRLSAQT